MKFRNSIQVWAVQAIVPLLAANASQEYCSSENTGSDYAAVTNIYQSNGACHDNCVANYAFAVVQYQQCWCSNYIPADQSSVGSCNESCPGYPDEYCGNAGSGLYGYIALDKAASGTAGSAASTETPSSTSTSDTSVSTTTSTSYSRSSSDSVTPWTSSVMPSTSAVSTSILAITSTSRSSSSLVLTPSSLQSSTSPSTSPSSTSQQPTSTSTTAQTSATPTPATTSTTETTSSSTSTTAAPTTSTSPPATTYTPSVVLTTRVVTEAGAVITQTVFSTPSVLAAQQSANTSPQQKGLSGGAIAGIVIGLLFGLVALLAGCLLLYRRRKDSGTPSETGASSRSNPRRNVSVLSKVGLLARGADNHQNMSENTYLYDDANTATGQNSVRHSMLFNGAASVAPVSPLGGGGHESDGSSRRHSRPLVYDQRLNPSALFANADAMGSRVSIADNQDYSRSLGRTLGVMNPDTRSSFASSRGPV